MSNHEMTQKLAQLESLNDHLTAELHYLDELMRTLGFSEGIATVKATAEEIIAYE
jgi:hypothetical protein